MTFTNSASKSLWGGLFSILEQKSASKPLKTCYFAYFSGKCGGLAPSLPPWIRYWFWLFFQKRLLPVRRCKSSTQTNTQSLASDSAIGLQLLQIPTCAQHYDDSRFFVLAQGRSPFHLSAREVTFIKTSNPAPSRQKQFVYSLKIVH